MPVYVLNLIPKPKLAARLLTKTNIRQLLFQVYSNLVRRGMFYEGKIPSTILPNGVYIEPTYACNRRCTGCYVEKGTEQYALQNNKIIEPWLAQHVVDFANKHHVNYVTWLGGEPLLPKVRDVVLETSEANPWINFNLCTNGDYLNEELADRIAKCTNLIPSISVDGFEKTNDSRRGKGSFEAGAKAHGLLKERRLYFAYMSTLMPENWREVCSKEFIEMIVERGCFAAAYSLYMCLKEKEASLSPEEYLEFCEELKKRGEEYPIYLFTSDFGLMRAKTNLEHHKRLVSISVGPSGEIRTDRGSVILGKITKDNSLEKIILSHETQRQFREKLEGTGRGKDPRFKIIQKM